MQCILYKIYFLEGFSYVLQIDMHFICTPMWTKFYSCKKWVLHPPLTPEQVLAMQAQMLQTMVSLHAQPQVLPPLRDRLGDF
jgi:hypothetical protein